MGPAQAVAAAAVFVWLGMVLAISFLEAPLKFRAPGVTLQVGLGIGRLVFRALNVCELALAAVVTAWFAFDRPPIVPAFAVALRCGPAGAGAGDPACADPALRRRAGGPGRTAFAGALVLHRPGDRQGLGAARRGRDTAGVNLVGQVG